MAPEKYVPDDIRRTDRAMKYQLPYLLSAPAAAIASVVAVGGACAGQVDLCIECKEPQQTYICRVDAPRARPGDNALQLYCVIRTAKDGGHKSCAVRRDASAPCAGLVKAYSYGGPAIPPAVQSAVRDLREKRQNNAREQQVGVGPDDPQPKSGEPETLIELTTRAVSAGKEGAKATGATVGKAAGGAGRTIGKVGKKAGKQVGKGVRGAKSAMRYAYECVKSLFRDCRSSDDEAPEATSGQAAPQETPR